MKLMTSLRNRLRTNLLKNKRGQGATEYILLLVVLVGLIMVFKDKIKGQFDKKMGELGDGMDQIQTK